MDFYQKYELIDPLPGDGTKSFRARQIASGREVAVHLLVAGKTQENDALLARLRTLPPESLRKLLEVGDNDGVPFVVTEAPPYQHLGDWLTEQERAAGASDAAKFTRAGAWKVPAMPAQPAAPPAPGSGPGEFTRMFQQAGAKGDTVDPMVSQGSLPTQHMPAPPVAQQPAQPGPAASSSSSGGSGPGEFTRMFQQSSAQQPAQPHPTPPTTAPPPPTLPPTTPPPLTTQPMQAPAAQAPPKQAGGPGEFTRMFQAAQWGAPAGTTAPPAAPAHTPAAQPVMQAPPEAPAPQAPSNQASGPGEFTRMFQAQPEKMATGGFRAPAAPPAPPGATQSNRAPAPTPPPPAPEPPAASSSGPGEFTRMFEAQPRNMATGSFAAPAPPQVNPAATQANPAGTQANKAGSAPPPEPPPAPKSAPGSFTSMFQAEPQSMPTGSFASPSSTQSNPSATQSNRPAAAPPPPAPETPSKGASDDFESMFQGQPRSMPTGSFASPTSSPSSTQANRAPSPAPPPPMAEPAAPASSGPGEFTRMFNAGSMGVAPPPASSKGSEPPEAPASGPSGSGEFTKMFSAPEPPKTSAAPPPGSSSRVSGPGEFTRMFNARSVPMGEPEFPSAPASPPQHGKSGPGDFTLAFNTPLPERPVEGDWAQPEKPAEPGELTRMMNAGSPRQEMKPQAPPETQQGEFTRMFSAQRSATPQGPQFPQAGFPPPPPAPAPPVQQQQVGEFTQMFGRPGTPASPVTPEAPQQQMPFPGGMGATGAFMNPHAQQPIAPSAPEGESEYTRMMKAQTPVDPNAAQGGGAPGQAGGGMAMPQFQMPGGMPKVSPGQLQVKGPAAQMQGAHMSAQGPQAHMQAPKVQAPPPPHMQMQMPPIKMETPKIPAAQVKPPAGPNILLIVIWCLVAFLIGAVLMVLLLKPKQEAPAPAKKGWNGGSEVRMVYAAIRSEGRRLG